MIHYFFISGEQSLRGGEEEDYEVFTVPLCQDCDKLGCDVTFHHKNKIKYQTFRIIFHSSQKIIRSVTNRSL